MEKFGLARNTRGLDGQGMKDLPSAIFTFGFPPLRFLHVDFVKKGGRITPVHAVRAVPQDVTLLSPST